MIGAADDRTLPVFVDFEASGLGPESYPIEVGWSYVDQTTGEVVKKGLLIRPTANWLASSGWEPMSARIHGISLERLVVAGRAPLEVAHHMNEVLSGHVLHADAPEFDWMWMRALFDEVGVQPAFTLATKDAAALLVEFAAATGMDYLDYTVAEREAALLAPRTHRAADDAAHWATFWRLVRAGFRAPPGWKAAR
jgi:hypothetical protein